VRYSMGRRAQNEKAWKDHAGRVGRILGPSSSANVGRAVFILVYVNGFVPASQKRNRQFLTSIGVSVFQLPRNRALQGPRTRLALFQKLLGGCLWHPSQYLYQYIRFPCRGRGIDYKATEIFSLLLPRRSCLFSYRGDSVSASQESDHFRCVGP